jgi:osmotically inducible protein OsmC
MVRSAEAIWHGGLKEGGGVVSSASKALTTSPYSFRTRFEDEKGAGPEELIAAAHASCYSMALSMILGDAGITAETIHTFAHITTDWISEAPKLTHIHLATKIEARGADREKVEAAAHQAVDGCPISRLLKPSAEITLEVIVCV